MDDEDLLEELEELNTLYDDSIDQFYTEAMRWQPEDMVEKLVHKLKKKNKRKRNVKHLLFFVNQIFHIVTVATKAQLPNDPWKHICIGSDFDGLIQSIDVCADISQLTTFGRSLVRWLPEIARRTNFPLPQRTPEDLVEDLLYNNAYEFLKRNF